jgi:hypothetical protein
MGIPGPCWPGPFAVASELVDEVPKRSPTSPTPSRAVRSELGGHLSGLDGVLVPAQATTYGYKRVRLPLVLSPYLDNDQWWACSAGPCSSSGVAGTAAAHANRVRYGAFWGVISQW